jgi:hypothetical protein
VSSQGQQIDHALLAHTDQSTFSRDDLAFASMLFSLCSQALAILLRLGIDVGTVRAIWSWSKRSTPLDHTPLLGDLK